MNRRILIILIGLAVVLILITGYAGSLNPAQADSSDQGTANVQAQQDNPGTISQGTMIGIPAGQATLGNAVGHYVRQ